VGFATKGCKVGGLFCEVHTSIGRVAVADRLGSHNIVGKRIVLQGEHNSCEWSVESRHFEMRVVMATFLSECVLLNWLANYCVCSLI
jgi:hypothetical protein